MNGCWRLQCPSKQFSRGSSKINWLKRALLSSGAEHSTRPSRNLGKTFLRDSLQDAPCNSLYDQQRERERENWEIKARSESSLPLRSASWCLTDFDELWKRRSKKEAGELHGFVLSRCRSCWSAAWAQHFRVIVIEVQKRQNGKRTSETQLVSCHLWVTV